MQSVQRERPEGLDAADQRPPSGTHICVFLAGNLPREQRYVDDTRALGQLMASDGIGLVYGGASVGLMNVLAEAVLEAGEFVAGVVPRQLSYQELAHDNLSRLYEVATMHERKLLMHEMSDGYIALPGGLGTLEETFEVLSWSQHPTRMIEKPCVFANIDGYYDELLRFLDHAVEKGLLSPENRMLARDAPTVSQRCK